MSISENHSSINNPAKTFKKHFTFIDEFPIIQIKSLV